jgi:hypothetical protein
VRLYNQSDKIVLAAKNTRLAPILAANNIMRSAFHPNKAEPKMVNNDASGSEKVTTKR